MSQSLILSCLWVIIAAIVALLPMRRQIAPGIILLIAAPVLLAYLGYQHGFLLVLVAVFTILSMFRRPLFYALRRLRERTKEAT